MAMANGSIASANNKGELGQPCLQPLDKEKLVERTLFVKMLALGALKCFNKLNEFFAETHGLKCPKEKAWLNPIKCFVRVHRYYQHRIPIFLFL